MLRSACVALCLLMLSQVCLPATGLAAVTGIEIQAREPLFEGREFVGVGAYELLRGRVHFALDPEDTHNQGIVDLDLCPRDERGLVHFAADLQIRAPVDLSRASGTLFYDVNNRGNYMVDRIIDEGGDHSLCRRGYIIVSSGWLAEVLPGQGLMRLDPPQPLIDGQPIRGMYRAEVVPETEMPRVNLTNRDTLGTYPPSAAGAKSATLTWRLHVDDPRVPIPREQWQWIVTRRESELDKHVLPEVSVELAGGFRPGYIYEWIYEAEGAIVQGTGLAGVRDLVSFLKYDHSERNPLRHQDRSAVTHTLGFGISQSGRALRCLLYEGFNTDEQDRQVFDGLIPHVSGAGLGYFNFRFACPSRYASQHTNHSFPCDLFPFTYGPATDPFSGRTDSILRQARAAGHVPKIMHIQNSAEYWHRSGSLVHTDPTSTKDAVIPEEVRIYAVGGAQHGPGDDQPRPGGLGQQWENPTDYRPHLRTMIVALDRWVRGEAQPPASRYPRLADNTLRPWSQAESGWQPLPGIRYPECIQWPEYFDFGPKFAAGIITQLPPRSRGIYQVRVPGYDRLNLELGMVQLPSIAVPVATYTGWNLRSRAAGAEGEQVRLKGSYIPLPRTKAERLATGDPRPSLAELYGDFPTYLQKFEAAARELVRQGMLLEEELPLLHSRAQKNEPLFAK